ncbi:MAG: pyrroline-5-carboxylate reductase [Acidimicrobiia bacterium]|nr:pyrroline-5-carboxylate reductase [Acidimicrobiia bacterium]
MEHPSVAILGTGAMGEVLAGGLLRAGWPAGELTLVVRREERRQELEERTGISATTDAVAALQGKAVIVIAVKPADVDRLVGQISGAVQTGQVVLSLAAGIPTSRFENALGDVPVVRAMPNTPAQIDQAITALCGGAYTGEESLAVAERVLSAVGGTIRLDEHLLDAVTAVSGTGPAYVFLLAEALTEAAIREGLPRHAAERLVRHTIRGAGMLLTAVEESPEFLRAQVTSPGGTTAAAVHVLEERGFRALVEDAVRAAAARSREMGEA